MSRQLIVRAEDPDNRGEYFDVQLRHKRVMELGRRSKGDALTCANLVPEILQNAEAIFEGLMRDEDEDRDRDGVGWRCYCGVPTVAYLPDGQQRAPYPGQIFLVFINDERVAYNWRWEKADHHGMPEGHDDRFRRQLK